jgi:diguanylate cyclase (GGDEF)-like protein/PAS domain S-box-containing protein
MLPAEQQPNFTRRVAPYYYEKSGDTPNIFYKNKPHDQKVVAMDEVNEKQVVENLVDGVYYVDRNLKITYWNKAAERISGFSSNEVIGKVCGPDILDYIDSEGMQLSEGNCPLHQTMRDGNYREASAYLHHKKGHRVPVTIRTMPIKNLAGKIVGGIESFMESYTQSQVLQELWVANDIGLTDALTLLGNKRFCEMSLNTRIYEFSNFNINFGVIYIDLDDFGQVNETYGKPAGDEVLIRISKTLAGVLRKLDFVTRWGKDEFVVIIPKMNEVVLKKVAERLRVLIKSSYVISDVNRVEVSASLGAVLAQPGDTPEKIIKHVQKLVEASKQAGGNMVTIE